MNKLVLISSVLQLAGGLVLIGLAIYYFYFDAALNGAIFLVIGLVFVFMPVRKFFLYFRGKRKKDEKDTSERHGFL